MDKILEDLLDIPNDYLIEIENKIEYEYESFLNNPYRFDKKCNCKTCLNINGDRSIADYQTAKMGDVIVP